VDTDFNKWCDEAKEVTDEVSMYLAEDRGASLSETDTDDLAKFWVSKVRVISAGIKNRILTD